MPEQGGLVTSFVDTMQQLSQMDRQKALDRQNAIQTAVENAMRQHSQVIEEGRVKGEQEHYKALEAQAKANEQIRQETQNRLAKQASWNQARDQARLEIARVAQQQKGGLSIEASRLRLMEFLTRQGYDPKDPEFQQTLDGVTGEFWAASGMTAPKGALEGLNLGKLGISPLAHEKIQDMESRRKQTDALTPLLVDNKIAQTAKIQADTELAKAHHALTDMQRDYIPKNFGLRMKEFEWRKLFQGKELNLREFANMTARIQAQLGANRNDLAAQRDRDGLVKWATSYKEAAFKVRSAAGLRVDKARDAVARAQEVVNQIKKMSPEDQVKQAAALVSAQGVIAGTSPQIKNLEADFNAAQKQFVDANNALSMANQMNEQKVTPSGTVVPFAPNSVRPSPPDRETVKALQRSEARNRSVRPRAQARSSLDTPVEVKSPTDLPRLKKGQLYHRPTDPPETYRRKR